MMINIYVEYSDVTIVSDDNTIRSKILHKIMQPLLKVIEKSHNLSSNLRKSLNLS